MAVCIRRSKYDRMGFIKDKKTYKPKKEKRNKIKVIQKRLKMSFGSIYDDSWWGNDDESNGWGIIYPV